MRVLLTVATVLLLSFPLASGAEAQVRRGLQELNVSGSASFADNVSSIFFTGSYGYFVTPMLEVGPAVTISRSSATFLGSTQSSTAGVLGAFAHVHLAGPGATAVPFLGGEAGLGIGDADGASFGVLGGAKFFVTPGGALTPAAFLRFDGDGDSVYGAQLGISLFF